MEVDDVVEMCGVAPALQADRVPRWAPGAMKAPPLVRGGELMRAPLERQCTGCGNRTVDGFRPKVWRFVNGLPFCTPCGVSARRHPDEIPRRAEDVPASGLWPQLRAHRWAAAERSQRHRLAVKRMRASPAAPVAGESPDPPSTPVSRFTPASAKPRLPSFGLPPSPVSRADADARVPSASPLAPLPARSGTTDRDQAAPGASDASPAVPQAGASSTAASAARRLFGPPLLPPIATQPPTTRLGAPVAAGGANSETLVPQPSRPDAELALPQIADELPSLIEAAAALPRQDVRRRDVADGERHGFDAARRPDRIRAGQFWALYDDDLVPSWYVRVVMVEQHPENPDALAGPLAGVGERAGWRAGDEDDDQAAFLAAIQFLDVEEDGLLTLDPEYIIQDSAGAFSHRIYPAVTERDDRFLLRPRRDEVWAVHTSRHAADSNFGLYYALLLADYEAGKGAHVCWLERCDAARENVMWEGGQQVLKSMANFSHPIAPLRPQSQVLYWKDLAGEGHHLYEIDPAALRHAAATPATSRPTPSSIRSTTSRLKERASRDAALPTAPPFSDPIDAEGNEYYDTGKATGFRTVYSECAHCLATDDRLTMVECAACHVTRHVHCLRRALADTEHFEDETETQRWRCSDCEDGITNAVAGLDVAQWPGLASQDDSGVRILRARRGAANDVELLLWNGSVADASRHAWVPARQLADCTHLLAQFVLGGGLGSLLDGIDLRPTVVAVDESTEADRGRGVQRLVYRFVGNRSYFGVTQLLGLFSEDSLTALERNCMSTLSQAYDGRFPPAGVQQTVHQRRSKLFFGRRYYDYQSGRTTRLAADVAPVPAWLTDAVIAPVTAASGTPNDFVDMVVMNYYHGAGASLGVHIDSRALFVRPILSLRLFAPCVLSFGCRGMGMTHRLQAVPLPRGCVTIMEGFAANKTKHCIRPADVHALTVSIMLRKTVASAPSTGSAAVGALSAAVPPTGPAAAAMDLDAAVPVATAEAASPMAPLPQPERERENEQTGAVAGSADAGSPPRPPNPVAVLLGSGAAPT